MSSELKLRRGSTVAHTTFTGADGEVTLDTDKNVIVSHDGVTVGGFPHIKAADLAAPNGAALVTYLPSGTGAIATNVQDKLRESVSVTDFGAIANTPTSDLSIYLNLALALHNTVRIPAGNWYGGATSAAEESKVVKLGNNQHIICDPGAVIHFGQSGGTYLPFFAAVGVTGWSITGASFVWTGQVVFGQDILSAGDQSVVVARLGAANAMAAVMYNTAICCIETGDFLIKDFSISSADHSKPCNYGISTIRTTGLFTIDGMTIDDVTVGCMSQGGASAVYKNIYVNGVNQDGGIPGHAIYTFVSNVIIDNVLDSGVERGVTFSSHTISYKGEGNLTVSNVISKRAEGVINWTTAGVNCSYTISNINWSDSVNTYTSINTVIYNSVESYGVNSRVVLSNLNLYTQNDRSLLGGKLQEVTGSSIILKKNTIAGHTSGFMASRFANCNLNLTLIQLGALDCPTITINSGGTEQSNNIIKMHLVGFNAPPVVKTNAVGQWRYNKLIYTVNHNVYVASGSKTLGYLGDPLTMFPDATIGSLTTNFVGISEDVFQWRSEVAGAVSVAKDFPVTWGTWLVTVKLTAVNETWTNITSYRVMVFRPTMVTGSAISLIQQIGAKDQYGAAFSNDPILTMASTGILNVAAAITHTDAQAGPVYMYVSGTRLGY